MKSLSEFQGYSPVFHEPTTLPEFFKTNLLSPARVVKAFLNDPQGHIRIFYYQYLRLCFQLENINYDYYIRKFEETINSDFHFIFYPDDDPALFNDMQAISLVMEFFGILGEGQLSVQAALNQYPIMDYIFVHFFRSLLILTDKTDALDSYLSRDQILGFLCPEFGVAIQTHVECLKYVETDIFVYQENPQAIYMAYMDYDEQNDNSTPVQPQESVVVSNEPTPIATTEKIEQRQTHIPSYVPEATVSSHRNSYVSSQFIDYTTYSNTNSKAPQSSIPSFLKQQQKQIEDPSKKKADNIYSQLIHQNNTNFTPTNQVSSNSINQSSKINVQISSQTHYPPNIPSSPLKDMYASHQSQYSAYDPFKYQLSQDNPPYKSTASNIFYESKKQPFYNPAQNAPLNNGIVGPGFIKKKNFGLDVSREFTNSIIMKSMAEPFRSNVQSMKARARNFRDSLNRYIK